ncbi:MAG TPA: radical SAM protein [Anaerolineae bacterium]|nr:radical SAM protein [Anaerolineae bacterium]
MSIVYGPVPSWRLGRSLGVDPVSTQEKTCSFNCIYCQLGPTRQRMTERQVFIQPSQLRQELDVGQVDDLSIDYVTFSGVAEPTLAVNLAELVAVVRERFAQPVAILTNSSLMKRGDVRRDLALFDVVMAKVDAPDEILYQRVNRPFVDYTLAEILWGIRRFREEFQGKLALQMMFVKANRDRAREMAEIARSLSSDEVQLNTPLRPSPVPPLSPAEMDEIEAAFAGLPVLNVYKAARPEVVFLDEEETRRRRPQNTADRKEVTKR